MIRLLVQDHGVGAPGGFNISLTVVGHPYIVDDIQVSRIELEGFRVVLESFGVFTQLHI
jgi:hypothetical protein